MSTPEAFMASDDAGSSLYCPNIVRSSSTRSETEPDLPRQS